MQVIPHEPEAKTEVPQRTFPASNLVQWFQFGPVEQDHTETTVWSVWSQSISQDFSKLIPSFWVYIDGQLWT